MFDEIVFTDIEGKKKFITNQNHRDLVVIDDEKRFKIEGVKTFIFGKDVFSWKELLTKIYEFYR
jgi:hypothetical protein